MASSDISFSPGVAGMVSWRMPDGTEIVCVGIPVEADKLREFVVRFMGAAGAGWNATRWSETLFGSAFEERFGEKVVVHHEDGPDGRRMFAIRRLPNDEPGSFNLAPANA
jgi:hypothetical protein